MKWGGFHHPDNRFESGIRADMGGQIPIKMLIGVYCQRNEKRLRQMDTALGRNGTRGLASRSRKRREGRRRVAESAARRKKVSKNKCSGGETQMMRSKQVTSNTEMGK